MAESIQAFLLFGVPGTSINVIHMRKQKSGCCAWLATKLMTAIHFENGQRA